ncbi:MAG: TonB-dependent receptor [Pseudomonadota bacterium]
MNAVCFAFTAALSPLAAHPPETDDEVIVFGRQINLIGSAKASSEGVVGYADFKDRPLSRVGELVEVIPGLIATQHSGSGKANQYFLRGFNLDHGTDFAAYFDGAPVNFRTHGHGQGYLDLNFIIPELVERIEFRKGPYYADVGDFTAAATASFKTYDALQANIAQATIGENGFRRGLVATSLKAGGGDLMLAGETVFFDGPFVLDEDLEKYNIFLKYSRRSGAADWRLSLSAYDSQWTSTDQIPLRAIEDSQSATGRVLTLGRGNRTVARRQGSSEGGLSSIRVSKPHLAFLPFPPTQVSRLGFIDPDLGGQSTRIALNSEIDIGRWSANAYAIYYDFTLFSNFTYFVNDPVNGDEFEQRDERVTLGGAVDYARPMTLAGRSAVFRAGGDLRYDDIFNVGLFDTVARERIRTVRDDEVKEFSVGGFMEVEINITERLRASVGARGDFYDFSVDASIVENSGDGTDAIFTPTASLAWRAIDALELYANYGQGFHSNDVRGAAISIDPRTLETVDPVDILVRAEGAEIGARFARGSFNATLTGFWLELDEELVFVGDAGTTEPNDATRRFGVEFGAFWRPANWIRFDATAAYTDARLKNAPSGEDRIPQAVENVFGAGVTIDPTERLTATLRLRRLGTAPLIEDASVASEPTTIVNLGLYYDLGPARFGFDILNLLDSEDADITYFFESQLPGEPAPVPDIHLHPVEPRQIRGSLTLQF